MFNGRTCFNLLANTLDITLQEKMVLVTKLLVTKMIKLVTN